MTSWNDNDVPLAYLITFRTYGTWLHGDERGSIDRYHNKFRGPRVPTNAVMQKQHEVKLKSKPVLLDARQRKVVESAIREVCEYRKRGLKEIHVRTNHAHVVVSIGAEIPEKTLRDFKAYSTRRLKEAGLWTFGHSPWADSGSKRYLWNEASVGNTCEYVAHEQERIYRNRSECVDVVAEEFVEMSR